MKGFSSLLPIILGVFLAACSSNTPSGSDGMQAFVQADCVRCHGANLYGGVDGPSLIGIHEHWNKDELVKFLSNPKQYKENNPRLQDLSYQYPEEMSVKPMDDAMKKTLAAFVLKRSREAEASN